MNRLPLSLLLCAALAFALAACSPSVTPTAAPADAQPLPATADVQGEPASAEASGALTAYPAAGDDSSAYPAPGADGVSLAGAYPAPYADETITSVTAVDTILAALATGNPADLQSHIAFSSAACTTADGLGGQPRCEGNEADGTTIEGLPVLESEGHWLRKGAIPTDFLAGPYQLLGVYTVNPNAPADTYYPAGQYAIVLGQADQPNAVTLLRVDENGIMRVDVRSDGVSSGFADAGQFLLPLQ
jgi:hypothetical protein